MDENNQMNEQQMGENPQADATPEQQAQNAEQNQQYGEQETPNQQMYGQYEGQQYQQPYGGQYQQYGAQGMPNQQMYGGGYQQYGAQGMPNSGYGQYGAQGMPNQQMYGGGYQQYGAQGMPNQQMYGQYQQPYVAQKPKNTSNIVGEVVEGITGLITTPQNAINKLISKGNITVGSIFIALQAVIAFFLVLVSFIILGSRSMGISSVGCAFYSLFFVLIMDFAAAGMLTLFGNTIFKGNLTFGKAVNVVGIFAIFQTVADILAVIFVIIGGLADVHFFISLGYILFVGITLLAFVVGIAAVFLACELNGNIKYYTIGVALIATVLIAVAVDNIGEKLFEDQNVSAYKVYSMMENADTVKEHDKEMKEYYEDYYDYEFDTYREYLKEYYD